MRMTRVRGIFFYLLLMASYCTEAQLVDDKEYELLWRIEGNGLDAPSYIFGTMHVDDSRAFNFSDSVMLAIERCEVFALESHSDSIEQILMNTMDGEKDTTNYVKRLLDSLEYTRLQKMFYKFNGYKLEELSRLDIRTVSWFLEPSLDRSDDKFTTVDPYLLGIAKTLNKQIAGLENAKLQAQFLIEKSNSESDLRYLKKQLEYSIAEYEEYFNELIEMYEIGNLELMQTAIRSELLFNDEFYRRNEEMVASIQSITKESTLFAAVGVSHLWGEKGLIQILRNRGYRVSVVEATFTDVADDYYYKPENSNWTSFTDSVMGISAMFPKYPQTYTDLTFARVYGMTDEISKVSYSLAAINNVMKLEEVSKIHLLKGVFSFLLNRPISELSEWTIDSLDAIKATYVDTNGNKSIVQAWYGGNLFYGTLMFGKEEFLGNEHVSKFSSSIELFEPVKVTRGDWITKADTIGAYQAQWPEQPNRASRLSPNTFDVYGQPIYVHIEHYLDLENLRQYLVSYNDFPLGYIVEDRHMFWNSVHEQLNTTAEIMEEPEIIRFRGYDARKFKMMLASESYAETIVVLRGNRVYKILVQILEKNKGDIGDWRFFESFQFTPYAVPDKSKLFIEEYNFEIQKYHDHIIEVDSTIGDDDEYIDGSAVIMHDTFSGNVYACQSATYGSYMYAEHLDSLYLRIIENAETWRDTIILVNAVHMNGKRAIEYIQRQRGGRIGSRNRLLLDGNRMYILSAFVDSVEIFSDASDEFFNSFNLTKKNQPYNLHERKSRLILSDLNSDDTLVQRQALGAFNYYTFIKEDLSILHESLNTIRHDDTLFDGGRALIVEELGILKDSSSIPHLEKLYTDRNTTEELKLKILYAFLDIESDQSTASYLEFLFNDPPENQQRMWRLFEPFSDSVDLTAQYFDELIELLSHENYRTSILNLAISLTDSEDELYVDLVHGKFDELTKYVKKDLDIYKQEVADPTNLYPYMNNRYQYLELMSKFHGKEITDFMTSELIKVDTGGYWLGRTIGVRIENDLPVQKKLVERLFNNVESRFPLMKTFIKLKKYNKIPKLYRSPDQVMKVCLNEYLYDDEGYADKITYLGSIEHSMGRVGVYRCTFSYSESEYSYLGLVGPQVERLEEIVDMDKIKSYSDYSTYDKNWKAKAMNMLEDYDEYGY